LRRAYGELAASSADDICFGDIIVNTSRMTVERDGRLVPLTPIEYKLLRHLVTHPRQPFTRNQLIEAVWGYDGDIGDDRTVDVHVRHVREKLEANPAEPRFIVTVRGIGYKFEP
jgi:DNA-binding response OmpR family regulator